MELTTNTGPSPSSDKPEAIQTQKYDPTKKGYPSCDAGADQVELFFLGKDDAVRFLREFWKAMGLAAAEFWSDGEMFEQITKGADRTLVRSNPIGGFEVIVRWNWEPLSSNATAWLASNTRLTERLV